MELIKSLRPWVTFGVFVIVASIVVPVCLFFSPGISFATQAVEGVWLACATWVLANASDAEAEYLYFWLRSAITWKRSSRGGQMQVSQSRQGQPLKNGSPGRRSGPLEFFLSLPATPVVWADLQLRRFGVPRYLRFAILNLATFASAPIWFFAITLLYLLLLLAISAVSFGVLLFWTGPLMVTCFAYLCFVPVWVISTYICASGPMMVCTWLLPILDNRAGHCAKVLDLTGLSVTKGNTHSTDRKLLT